MHLPSETGGAVNQRFVAGNPLTGQKATIVTPEILNGLTYEIANVITDAGIELVQGLETQLLTAIQTHIDRRVSAAITAALPGIINAVLLQVGTGGGTGSGMTCAQFASRISVTDGVLRINCDDIDSVNGAANNTDGILTLNISGDAAISNGVITLTDSATETYEIADGVITMETI